MYWRDEKKSFKFQGKLAQQNLVQIWNQMAEKVMQEKNGYYQVKGSC